MSPEEFEFISQAIKKRSGLALTPDKQYLLESRLQPIMRTCGSKSMSEFLSLLKLKAAEELYMEVTDAMTTNESMFFRDTKPFNQLRNAMLPRIVENKAATRSFRVWSAACSNGQEPYSILMTLLEEIHKLSGWNYDIVATDISPRVLEKAKKGIYTQFEVQRGLPIQMLLKYFKQVDAQNWQIHEKLRETIAFRVYNLLDDLTPLGKFDIIFCRNVLIYFDEATKSKVLDTMAGMLNPGGFLLLGSSETTIGLTSRYKVMEGEHGLHMLA